MHGTAVCGAAMIISICTVGIYKMRTHIHFRDYPQDRDANHARTHYSGVDLCLALVRKIPNTKYTCDTGQTRNQLLEQLVHLANHAAGHWRPGTTHQTA